MATKTTNKKWIFFYSIIITCLITVTWIIGTYQSEEINHTYNKLNAINNFNPLLHILLGLVVIISTSRLLHIGLKKIYQPRVISEMIAGIAIGPSLLGLFFPEIYHYMFPPNIIPYFGNISQLGIVLYMYLIGLEVDFSLITHSNKTVIAIAKASIIIPFTIGTLLALGLYNYNTQMHPDQISNFTVFALFVGISMSITAFPVLARILTDQNMQKTALGSLAMTCAAINDVTAWCLLALIIGITQAVVTNAVITIIATIVFVAIIITILKPLAKQLSDYAVKSSLSAEPQIALLFVALLIFALVAEYIGIHAIFGAFLLGVITPRNNKAINKMSHSLQDVISIIFLPAFFAYIGMKTQINLIGSLENWLLCGVIIILATIGKFGGTYFTARLFDLNNNLAASLGFLMNTRGLVELVVLNIGLEIGIITPQLFAILVIMALVTTCTTGPALYILNPEKNANLQS
ncbi:MAG: cation:proton antiporter [Gammaproteobacteria bacterium]|nr:cation:proton antiporter [Gammaproteobacteria bacterium]